MEKRSIAQPRSQGPFSTSRKHFLEVEEGPWERSCRLACNGPIVARKDSDVKPVCFLIVDALLDHSLLLLTNHSFIGVVNKFEARKTKFSAAFVSFICFYFKFFVSVL